MERRSGGGASGAEPTGRRQNEPARPSDRWRLKSRWRLLRSAGRWLRPAREAWRSAGSPCGGAALGAPAV